MYLLCTVSPTYYIAVGNLKLCHSGHVSGQIKAVAAPCVNWRLLVITCTNCRLVEYLNNIQIMKFRESLRTLWLLFCFTTFEEVASFLYTGSDFWIIITRICIYQHSPAKGNDEIKDQMLLLNVCWGSPQVHDVFASHARLVVSISFPYCTVVQRRQTLI